MQYCDLSYGRVGSSNEPLQFVFPELRYVGWLDAESDYPTGNVSEEISAKLKELLFLDIKNLEDKEKGGFSEAKAVQIHQRYRRGKPKLCPICGTSISVSPGDLEIYKGVREKVLGRNELCIPSLKENEFYTSPTLIYHYIIEHNYQPPREYLEALNAFDPQVPFDANEAQSNLKYLQVPTHEVDELHLKPLQESKYMPG